MNGAPIRWLVRASEYRTDRWGAARLIPRPTDRDEWLAARRPWFNASAAGALFDVHPFTTLTAIVRGKLDPGPLVDNGNAATRRGQYLEGAIAEWWSDEHGLAVFEPDVMYARGPILATLDRRIVGNDADAIEIKTTAKHVTRPEPHWVWQVMAQMYAAGLERVHLVVLDASMSLATYVIARDDDAIARLVARADDVMRYVARGEWPPDLPRERAVRHSDRVLELDVTARQTFTAWLAVREQLHEFEALEAAHKAELVQLLGDAQAATVDGCQVLTYRSHTRSNIDLARLRAEHPDLVAELSTEAVVRVLRPMGGNQRGVGG